MAESQSRTEPAKSAESKDKAGQTQSPVNEVAGESDARPGGPAAGSPASAQDGGVVVPAAGADPFSLKTSEAIDPRTGEDFDPSKPAGGVAGFEQLSSPVGAIPAVNPDRIPAEVTHGVSPDAGGNKLLAAAQAKAPSLTQEFVDQHELGDEYLAQIARGEVPPPPTNGPLRTSDLYLTPGGWQSVPPGQNPEDVGKNSIARR